MTGNLSSSESETECINVEDEAFNIQLVEQNCADFFGVARLPAAKVPDGILTTYSSEAAEAVKDMETHGFLHCMEDAMAPCADKSAVDNFSIELFRLMRYHNFGLGYSARFSVNFAFRMCHRDSIVQTDVCVMDRNNLCLVVQEDKQDAYNSLLMPSCSQLVIKAIAAFHNNNRLLDDMGKKRLSDYLMPGIVMRGTTPFFYKIQVTQDLVNSVEKGERPTEPTKVYQLKLGFPFGFDRGMIPLANRKVALEYYEAFKAFVFQTQPE
jgi:hypothetical protein